jgi:hypothetical protein
MSYRGPLPIVTQSFEERRLAYKKHKLHRIVVGIALGRLIPGVFHLLGSAGL